MLLTLSYPRLPLERIDVTTGYLVTDELAARLKLNVAQQ
jgi:hypothetical protein